MLCCGSNLYHLIELYHCRNILVDSALRDFVKVLSAYVNVNALFDVVVAEDCSNGHVLFQSDMKDSYDLVLVSEKNRDIMSHVFFKCKYVFVKSTQDTIHYTPFIQWKGFVDGTVFINPFVSIQFDTSDLSLYERNHVRDTSHRFLSTTKKLLKSRPHHQHTEQHSDQSLVVEILSDRGPSCSHASVFGESVVRTDPNGNKQVGDGTEYFRHYHPTSQKIDLMVFNKPSTSVYKAAKAVLKIKCMILLDDTDLPSEETNQLLVTLLGDGYYIVFKGRMTLLYKGSPGDLWKH